MEPPITRDNAPGLDAVAMAYRWARRKGLDYGFSEEEFEDHVHEAVASRNERLLQRNKTAGLIHSFSRLSLQDVFLAFGVHRLNENAMNAYYDGYDGYVRHVLGKAVSEELWDDAYDLCMDKMPDYLGRYTGQQSLRGWLTAFCQSRARDVWRQASKEPGTAPIDELPDGGIPDPDPGGVENKAEVEDCHQLVRECYVPALAELEPGDRAILALAYEQAMKNKDIALVLGLDPGTTTRRRKKAETKFKTLLLDRLHARKSTIAQLLKCLSLLKKYRTTPMLTQKPSPQGLIRLMPRPARTRQR